MIIEKERVFDLIQKRKIKNFVHFTRESNLLSILENGLLSRYTLDEGGINYTYNDEYRFDEELNSVSVSVTWPNYKMFYKLRCENKTENWVVLILDAYKIAKLDCAYCFTNAASNEMTAISLEDKKSSDYFELLFKDDSIRTQLGLQDNETTDPQAEILVFDDIPVSAIKHIAFLDEKTMEKYSYQLEIIGITCDNEGEYFGPRHDYEYWSR